MRQALEAGVEAPLLVAGADTVFTRGDIATAAKAWTTSEAPGGLGYVPSLRRTSSAARPCAPPVDA